MFEDPRFRENKQQLNALTVNLVAFFISFFSQLVSLLMKYSLKQKIGQLINGEVMFDIVVLY